MSVVSVVISVYIGCCETPQPVGPFGPSGLVFNPPSAAFERGAGWVKHQPAGPKGPDRLGGFTTAYIYRDYDRDYGHQTLRRRKVKNRDRSQEKTTERDDGSEGRRT